MASANITSGRESPLIKGLLMAAAGGNTDKRIAETLPINFTLEDQSMYAGNIRTLPTAQAYGDSRVVGTGALKRAGTQPYYDLTRERSFGATAYECVERSGKVTVTEQDQLRTLNEARSGLQMRKSRVLQLLTGIRDDFEYDVLSSVFSTSVFPNAAIGALTGGAQVAWTGAASSPSRDKAAVDAITRTACGETPTFACITWDVLNALRYHAETLGVSRVTSGAAIPVDNGRTLWKLSDVLAKWADLWELKDGLFPVRAQRNSANPNQTAVLADMVTGKIAFHTANGLMNAQQIEKDVEILGGVQSIVCVQEFAPRGYEFQMEDPVGVKIIAARSYDIVAPNTGGAYILTGVV